MIYPELFLNFLMVGALSFGGGFGMISLIRDAVLSHGWLTEAELMSFIAVAESTPGPIAVNMATFVGASQAGALGAFLATLGVVLPAFLIILLIASVLKNLMKYRLTNAFLSGVRPCVVGMIPYHGPFHAAGLFRRKGSHCPGWAGPRSVCRAVGGSVGVDQMEKFRAPADPDDSAVCPAGNASVECLKGLP